MSNSVYINAAQNFTKIIDFFRFGVTLANKKGLYYGHGTDNAWDDIWSLIVGSLSLPYSVDRSILHATLLDAEKELLVKNLEARIESRIPVPYLINSAYFCDLPFYVDNRVLIPRSPIAELIRQQFTPWVEDPSSVTKILDLCTGSGCIGIACCYAFPDAIVDAVDISQDALAVAEINRRQHEVLDNFNLIQSDCFANVFEREYNIIVSNPPYVGSDEMRTLPNEYLHEPNLALECGNNGLTIVENILKNAKKYLADDGILIVEVGNSEQALISAYPDVPFTWLEFENGGQGVFLLTAQQLKQL